MPEPFVGPDGKVATQHGPVLTEQDAYDAYVQTRARIRFGDEVLSGASPADVHDEKVLRRALARHRGISIYELQVSARHDVQEAYKALIAAAAAASS